MPELGDEMSEHFRGVLADVVDGQAWAGYAGPAVSVRKRGQRQRLRHRALTATGAAAAVVAVAAAGTGLAGGGSNRTEGPASVPGTVQTTPLKSPVPTGSGPYVDLAKGLLRPDDLGSGFTAMAVQPMRPAFDRALCAQFNPITTAGTPIHQELDGLDTDNVRLMTGETVFQFADPGRAHDAYRSAYSSAQASSCHRVAGQPDPVFQDVPGVGDGAFVFQQPWGMSSDRQWIAFSLVGSVLIEYDVMPGSDKGLKTLPDGWLTGVLQKAVSRVRSAPSVDQPQNLPLPTPQQPPSGVTEPSPTPLPVSEPVDGYLFAPADLGKGFGADKGEAWHDKRAIPASTSVDGMMYRATITGGDGEFMVNERVYRFADASAARAGLAAYDQFQGPSLGSPQPLAGFGDKAWIKHWKDQQGGVTVAVQVGDKVLTFDVLAGGASADQPIPGGDAWVQQIAHTALQRLAAAK
ncbi:hypothetical protein [Catenulispora subtropica]|uniref:PknH-like extracellular domain-containing protein n=1 Tax=Catenulispora subtropica TaxID=450798 RepID=A0ABP5CY06_9ACTN